MKRLFFMLCLLTSVSLWAQKTVKGIVVDNAKEPIIGASVVENGTTNGVVTDIDGKFTLKIGENAQVKISFVGYKTKMISAKQFNGGEMVIRMDDDSELLQEVVVTGYGGKQLRTKVTNSISKVEEKTLSQGLFSNPAQALSGAVAGLQVQQTSGNPGATPTITLRGGTNFDGSGSPLVIIDGQVRDALSDINPEDIESMEVLKDAGATAIYGARANNGVILVTTKRGKEGKTEVNLKAKFGWNHFNNSYDFMNAGDYLYWMRTSYKNAYMGDTTHPDGSAVKAWSSLGSLTAATPYGTGNKYFDTDGVTPLDGNKTSSAIWSPMVYSDNLSFLLNQGWETMTDPVYGGKIIYKNFDIADFNIQTPSFSQDYNLNVSGGNDKGHYYAGMGYNKSEGTAINNWYQRITFTFNADYKLKSWLTSSSNFSFADAKWYGLPASQTAENNYFSRCLSLPSTFRGYNAAGEQLLGNNYSDGNQQYNINSLTQDNNTDKFIMGQSFTANLYDGLNLKVGATWQYSDEKYEAFYKDYMRSPGTYVTSRNTSAQQQRTFDQTYNAVLTYDKQLTKDHYVSAMAGFEYYSTFTKGFSASGSGAPTDEFGDLSLTATTAGSRSIDSWHYGNRLMSFFGRANYDYKSKYLFSFVIRKDGYSKLAKDNRWGVFPGVSAGWVFGKEAFMEQFQDIISFAKLRASYGVNGNVNKDFVGNYTVQGSYGTNKYNGNVGYLLGALPNPYLTWETSKTVEVGLDLSFLQNRISANLTYYTRNTYDKFANITVPSTSGVTSVVSNNGKIRNSGFEFETSFKILDKKDWKWNLGLNGSYNINKVIELPNNGAVRNGQNMYEVYTGNGNEKEWVGGYQEGRRPGDFYAFVAEGLYRTQAELDADAGRIDTYNTRPLYVGAEGYNKLNANQKASALPVQLGDVKWKDVNGDGVIDQYDMVKVGNTTPKWMGGFNTQFSWKDLTLSARFDYRLGFTVYDWRTAWIMGNMQGTYNTIEDTKDTWTPDNVNAKYPTYVWADQLGKGNYNRTTSMFAYSGSYLALRELMISYRLPSLYANKIGCSNIEVSVTGQNLGYWTKAKHIFSPEAAGTNYGGYPLPKTLILGVNVSF
ncbi:TonB-dependent receptor [Bacteroides helcogenes]|uniref:TonB-dependent receptor plug n=1 Tax=Bacteroides helcogenes (strain ATCC 35417 / DSM 20613 / JCM 6297 / CCUG 15421 / P 36-108) TaxID=693979 RepID=E6SN77_BACT6|nr:TonB-dependent receptor [Bacteroides helcogenes]ADV44730.1 TonB-dependent receptor plug [Bacteroides helcogenes P 36-108]MDY5238509.1 TonB-dependent receptor [Bacteroides helcogenes]